MGDEFEESTASFLLGSRAYISPSEAIDGEGAERKRCFGRISSFYPKHYPMGAFRIKFQHNLDYLFYPDQAHRAARMAMEAERAQKRLKTAETHKPQISLDSLDIARIEQVLLQEKEEKGYAWQLTGSKYIHRQCRFRQEDVEAGQIWGEGIVVAWLPEGDDEDDFEMWKVYFPPPADGSRATSETMFSDYGGPDTENQNHAHLRSAMERAIIQGSTIVSQSPTSSSTSSP